MQKALNFLFFLCFLASCASTQPNQEYALAQSALSLAKKFEADKFSPRTYTRALRFYRKAVSFYKKQDYEEARNFFEESIQAAEKAELNARIKAMRESE